MNPTISQWSVVVLPTSALAELIEILDEADILDEVVDALLDADELRYTVPGADAPLSKPPWEYTSVLGNPIVRRELTKGGMSTVAKSAHEPIKVCPTCKVPVTFAPRGVLLHDRPTDCPIKTYIILK